MRFGKNEAEAAEEPGRGAGGEFMRYLGDGDNIIRVLDEPEDWVYYWEHYNPGGNPFPCTNERDSCPGCTDENEKVSKASRKIAFNALNSFNGKEYVNVWKVPKTVSDKLKTRKDRLGTITDRDYLITRFKKDNGFYDYDVEGMDKMPVQYDKEQLRDPEDLLVKAYEEAWGTSAKAANTQATSKQATREQSLQEQISRARAQTSKPEPKAEPAKEKDDIEVSEEELRNMSFWDLVDLCQKEGYGRPEGENVDEVVSWIMKQPQTTQ